MSDLIADVLNRPTPHTSSESKAQGDLMDKARFIMDMAEAVKKNDTLDLALRGGGDRCSVAQSIAKHGPAVVRQLSETFKGPVYQKEGEPLPPVLENGGQRKTYFASMAVKQMSAISPSCERK